MVYFSGGACALRSVADITRNHPHRVRLSLRRQLHHAYVQHEYICGNMTAFPNTRRSIFHLVNAHSNLAHIVQQVLLPLELVGEIMADRKSTRLNSSHSCATRMPSAA